MSKLLLISRCSWLQEGKEHCLFPLSPVSSFMDAMSPCCLHNMWLPMYLPMFMFVELGYMRVKYSMSLIANYTPTYCALGHCMPVLSLHGRLNHDTQIVIAANAGGITNLSRTEAGAIPHTTLCRRKHWTSPPHLRILQQP